MFLTQYAICMLLLIIGNAIILFGYLKDIDGETKARKDINEAWNLQLNGTDAMAEYQKTVSG